MDVIRLVIADEDEEFVVRFNQYVKFFEIEDVMMIKSFTSFERLQHFLLICDEQVTLLVCEGWLDALITCHCHHGENHATKQSCAEWTKQYIQPGKLQRMIVSSTTGDESTCHYVPVVHKYQPLHDLISSLRQLRPDKQSVVHTGTERLSKGASTHIISFYGAVGGCGKTTAALNVAKQLTIHNQRLLFISLEANSTIAPHAQQQHHARFDQLLYDLKHKEEAAIIQGLGKYIQYDEQLQFNCLSPMYDVRNSLDIAAADIAQLIRLLQQLHDFDVIIIDLDHSLNAVNCAAMTASDRIIWLMLDDVTYMNRMNRLLHSLPEVIDMSYEQIKGSIVFVLNKYLGKVRNVHLANNEVSASHYLPYVPQWKGIASVTDWFKSEVFNNSMATLINDVLQMNMPVLIQKEVVHFGSNAMDRNERSDSTAIRKR